MNKKLSNTISCSTLTPEQQKDLLEAFSTFDEEQQADIGDIFEEDSSLVPIMYTNFVSKVDAAKSDDEKAWKDIVSQESQLKKIQSDEVTSLLDM